MDRERFQRVEELFARLAAIDDPAERERRLDEACGSDAALRREVQELLAADRPESPAISRAIRGAAAAVDRSEDLTGTRIGPYAIERLIGSGGFGSVYEAVQREPIERRVALKVLRPEATSGETVERFKAERQTLARMDHPSIARVFDAGESDDGRLYFVMELIEGRPITEYCDAAGLDSPARLKLFESVCLGVQHAHQKGVIHRDLKPTNVLVTEIDGLAVPKIIDFGIAKAVDDDGEGLTRNLQLVGTPQYMSPEQAGLGGDVDTRSDIYSLGVLLYELLTGATPFSSEDFERAGIAEIQRVIREETPLLPSARAGSLGGSGETIAGRRGAEITTLTRQLRGDLDWIVMRSLEKEPDRRYPTAGGFADDVGRYLDGFPVEAGPPSNTYRLRKFVRRHRATVFGAAAVVLLALGWAITSSLQAAQVARERDTATFEAEVSEEMVRFLLDLFLESDPDSALGRGHEITARELLDIGADKVDTDLEDQPRVRARMKNVLGNVYRELGDNDRSLSLLTAALDDRLELQAPADTLARTYTDLATTYHYVGEHETSVEHHERALELLREVEGDTRSRRASILWDLGETVMQLGRTDDARAAFEEALGIREELDGKESIPYIQVENSVARVLLNEGRWVEALALFEAMEPRAARLYGDRHSDYAATLVNLGMCYQNVGRTGEAVAMLTRSLEIRLEVLEPGHVIRGATAGVLASAQEADGDLEGALDSARQAVRLHLEGFDADHQWVIETRAQVARYELLTGNRPDGDRTIAAVAADIEASTEMAGSYRAWLSAMVGDYYENAGERAASADWWRRARDAAAPTFGEDSYNTVEYARRYGHVLAALGRLDEAAVELERSVPRLIELSGDDTAGANWARQSLAGLRAKQGRYEEAMEIYREVLDSQGRMYDTPHARIGDTYYNMACAAALAGRPDEALDYLDDVLETEAAFRAETVLADTELASLHGLERFDAFVARLAP